MFNIVPQPNEIIITGGKTCFTLTPDTTMSKAPYIDEFRDFVKKQFDIRIHRDNENTENAILLKRTDEIMNDEGYRLVCRDGSVYIYGKTDAGCFYGLQTLKQLLLQGMGQIPDMFIEDAPRYKYRGFMLDAGRYFWTVKEIKRFIDLIALHKLNVFHWHLTEDQGWRVEMQKHPLLTEKGARRSHTNFGIKPEEGFYTQEDIREIVEYCHSRFIKVVPEFDIPGHSTAAIACYPHLSCFHRNLKVATHWGVKHDILCAGKETTYEFVFDIIDEFCSLFPDEYIHIGGDEAVKMRWKLCPDCQKLMHEQHFTDEEQLQQYFMNRVAAYVKQQGRTPVMWCYDDIKGDVQLDRDIVWQMCGANRKNGIVEKELKNGRKMYNSSAFPYYLDFPYGWVNLKQAYEFEPDLGENMLGIETPLWTEYVPNTKRADYCMFPRLGAIAEAAWSAPEDRSYERFSVGLPEYFDLLNAYHVYYATTKQAMPSFVRGKIQSLWFDRRLLHWQGMHNLLDDAVVEAQAKKAKKADTSAENTDEN